MAILGTTNPHSGLGRPLLALVGPSPHESGGNEPAVRGAQDRPDGDELTDAISASMVDLYSRHYGHDRTTATTYVNDNVVVCLLEDILSVDESSLVAAGRGSEVIDDRVTFQNGMQDEFTTEIERLTGRRVTAFMSANQTTPGVACELFFLELPPTRPMPGQTA